MDDAEEVEHFFGVYLLYCTNPKYKGRTYIGFTVNPRRRIKQHNAGKDHGGAWRTSNRGPWNMVLIVHGFPNNISALRFEWAWQHPLVSRRLKHVPKKKPRQKTFEYCLMVLNEMLRVGPWCRLPLTVRWLDYEFYQQYSGHVVAPLHMPLCCGKVTAAKKKKKKKNPDVEVLEDRIAFCTICDSVVLEKESISCVKPRCLLVAHLICLARRFSKDDMILPVEGSCPSCNANVLWGELIRKKIGCYDYLQETASTDSDDDDELL